MRRIAIGILFASSLLQACSSIDCELGGNVVCRWVFSDTDGNAISSEKLFSITTKRSIDGSDTTLVNMVKDPGALTLPMSYSLDVDTLTLTVHENDNIVGQDVIYIEKTNRPSFETVDCGMKIFHDIISVKSSHEFIDTIHITFPIVDGRFNEENIHVYLHPMQ